MTTSNPSHLIIICCHAIYIGGPTKGHAETEWLLSPFQAAESSTFTQHLKTGLSLLHSTPSSLLFISGSKTRASTSRSEAQSYLALAQDHDFWGLLTTPEERQRVLLEEQALDSYGNLLFSILGFWKKVGVWPERISVVSHEFKRRRFLKCHVPAVGFNPERVHFVGVDPDYMLEGSPEFDQKRRDEVLRGEDERGVRLWREDPLGKGELLRGKRKNRNYWGVGRWFFESEDERRRSGVVSEVRDGEDFLIEGATQPWE